MSAHTKTPWRVEDGTDLIWGACNPDDQSTYGMGYSIVQGKSGTWGNRQPDMDEREANAALIVRAVNRDHHFDALVKALEFYANPNNWIDTPSWDGDPECITPNAIPVTREDGHPCDCGDTARAAIALVRNSSDGKSA